MLLKFDNDYDALISTLKEELIIGGDLKSSNDKIKVLDLLEMYYSSENVEPVLKSGQSIIEQLIEKYPDLQISIPVHAEDWDEDSYTPDVVFITDDFIDLKSKKIPGFNSKGEQIYLDAINEPDVPVIVVGFCERYNTDSNFKSTLELTPPSAPNSLQQQATESGIRLNWSVSSGSNSSNTTGFKVYRKSAAENTFVLKSIIYNFNNRAFDDIEVMPTTSYTYYVVAFYNVYNVGSVESDPSNYVTVTTPNRPNSVSSFDAILFGTDNVQLQWAHDYTQPIRETIIEKYTVNVNSGFQPFGVYDPNTVNCFDENLNEGKKIQYMIRESSAFGLSNAKYDLIHVPYRDISLPSKVIVSSISTDLSQTESWVNGAPEFYLTLTGVNQSDKKTFKYEGPLDFDFPNRTSSHAFNSEVFLWHPGFWYDMITFHLIEYERYKGDLKIDIEGKYSYKDSEKQNLLGSVGAKYSVIYNHGGDDICGTSYMSYYDNPDITLNFHLGTSISFNDNQSIR